jgi:hypothetical protein
MKERSRYIWGFALILIGGFLLAVTTGLIPDISANLWAVVFAVVSILFFVTYFVSGLREWGWLFPACIIGAVAAIIALNEMGVEGEWLGTIMIVSVAIPFWVALISDRKNNWWAIIPGGILLVVALAPLIATTAISGELFGALFPGVIGLVFLGVFFIRREHWWAIIPGGVMLTIAATVLVATLPSEDGFFSRIFGGVFFGGLALTFASLWLMRSAYGTGWAKYPAAALAGVALLALFIGAFTNFILPILFIGLGGWILYRSLRPKG